MAWRIVYVADEIDQFLLIYSYVMGYSDNN